MNGLEDDFPNPKAPNYWLSIIQGLFRAINTSKHTIERDKFKITSCANDSMTPLNGIISGDSLVGLAEQQLPWNEPGITLGSACQSPLRTVTLKITQYSSSNSGKTTSRKGTVESGITWCVKLERNKITHSVVGQASQLAVKIKFTQVLIHIFVKFTDRWFA